MDNDSNFAVRVKFNGPPQRTVVGDKLMKSLGRPKGCITIVTTLMTLLAVSVEAQTFGSDSADFSGAPFLHAHPGEVRHYQGQAAYTGTSFDIRFTEETFLGVRCGRFEETGIPGLDKEATIVLAAKDTGGQYWLFKWVVNGQTLFSAQSLGEVVRF